MPLVVRRVKVADLPVLESLELETVKRAPGRERWMDTFRHLLEEALGAEPEGVLVADYDGRAIGAVVVRVRGEHPLAGGPVGRVEVLTVAPGWKDQGIAARLLREAEAYLKVRGCKHMAALLPADAGASAEAYQAFGFRVAAWELERPL